MMIPLRQIALSLTFTLLFFMVVMGAFSMSLSEGMAIISDAGEPTEENLPFEVEATSLPGTSPTPRAEMTRNPEANQGLSVPTMRLTPTSRKNSPTPTVCAFPPNWQKYVIQPGDSLANLAEKYNLSSSDLMKANCLISTSLLPGTILYVPRQESPQMTPTREPTATQYVCIPRLPVGWNMYIVQPNDNLYRLSLAANTSVYEIQRVNCLGNSTYIRVGDVLYLPVIPTRLTSTPTSTQTLKPSSTPTVLPTRTKTATPTIVRTSSSTPTPTPTRTVTPTTPVVPVTTSTPTPTRTNTPTPTGTLQPTPTFTPQPTSTPTPTRTHTPPPTSTPTPTPLTKTGT